MHRKSLLSLLHIYRHKHPEEVETIRSFIQFVQDNTNCFDRGLSIGHLTASAWLINPDQSKVLLTHHRKLNKWLQLGGHADGENNLLLVALREAYEESGLERIIPISEAIFDIDIHHIPEHRNVSAHFHYDVRFALRTKGSEAITVSAESHDLSWIAIHSLQEKNNETSILRMRRKWLERNFEQEVEIIKWGKDTQKL